MNDKTQELDDILLEATKGLNKLKKEDLSNIYYIRNVPYNVQGRLDGEFNAKLFMMEDIKRHIIIRESVHPGDYAMNEYMDIFRCTTIQESVVQGISSYTSATAYSTTAATSLSQNTIIRSPVWSKIDPPGKYLLDQFKELINLLVKADKAHMGRLDNPPKEAKRTDKPDEDKLTDFDEIKLPEFLPTMKDYIDDDDPPF